LCAGDHGTPRRRERRAARARAGLHACGNTRHTRDIRIAHAAPKRGRDGRLSEDELFADLLRVTGGERTSRWRA